MGGKSRASAQTSKPQEKTSPRFPLIADKNLVSRVFRRGLVQGVLYGAIASALLFFWLVLLAMTMLQWRAKEPLALRGPELLGQPETSRESEAATPRAGAGAQGSGCRRKNEAP